MPDLLREAQHLKIILFRKLSIESTLHTIKRNREKMDSKLFQFSITAKVIRKNVAEIELVASIASAVY